MFATTYNERIPHYLFARALFKTKSPKAFFDVFNQAEPYGTWGIETSHNAMHNLFRFIMS
jgi:hypothetical protein